jgi:hypothetical protein
MIDVPLLIEFAPQTSLYRERDLVSQIDGLRMTFRRSVITIDYRIRKITNFPRPFLSKPSY